MWITRYTLTGALIVCAMVLASFAEPLAQEAEKPDVDEIARKMSNPTLPLMNITNLIDWTKYTGDLPGASDQSAWSYLLQPPLPYALPNGENIIFRPAVPLLFNPPVLTGTGWESAGFNLGDIGYDLFYGGTTKTGLLRGVGIVGNIPASTDEELRGEWALGVEGIVGVMRKWGVFLVLLTQQWDISGDAKTSRLGGQYAAAFSLPGGWQIASSPPFSYNWDTQQLTLPLGLGSFRTVMVGETPVKLGVQVWYYVSQPDAFGPEWTVRFQIQPSVRRPW